MQILNKIEEFIFPCTRKIERVREENETAFKEAVCAIRSLAGHTCVRNIINDRPEDGRKADHAVRVQSTVD